MNKRLACSLTIVAMLWMGAPAGATEVGGQGLVQAGETPDLFLLYTGDVIGYLHTCGCKRNPAGGLGRRAWVLDRLQDLHPEAPKLLVDSGNFSDHPTPAGDVKTQALIEAMGKLGYHAANIGERDLRLGYDDLMKRAGHAEFPLLSANIVREDNQEPVFKPHHIVELDRPDSDEPYRIGLIGVARYNPVFLKAGPDDSNLVIRRPADVVQAEATKLHEAGVDLIVVLAALHKQEAERILTAVPHVRFVIGAYAGTTTAGGEEAGRGWLLYSGNQGKRIGETRVYFDRVGNVERQSTNLHFLTNRYPSDDDMTLWVNTLEIPGEQTGAPAAAGGAR